MPRKKKDEIVETVIVDSIPEEQSENVTDNIIEKKPKRVLKSVNLEREFEWIPTEEIDCENPIKFKFKMCANNELAYYNDSLYKAEGTKIITCQNVVDMLIVKDKVFLIDNLLIEDDENNDRLQTLIRKNDIKDFFEKTCPSEWISDLASYIRVISAYKGEI